MKTNEHGVGRKDSGDITGRGNGMGKGPVARGNRAVLRSVGRPMCLGYRQQVAFAACEVGGTS